MNRNLKRMLFALIVTAAGYAATEYWYRSGLSKLHNNSGKTAVATLAESVNEVQRKEARRVIWESITLNDELFPGEAIRTTEKAEAKIQLKSGTTIHLEPDSLVVLEENGNGLALDFLQGNLFVQGGKDGADKDNLTLKTGSGQIKIKSADMSLSKDTSGQVNLEVFKGQAELEQGSQKMALVKDKSATLSDKGMAENKDRLQLLAPQAGDTILLNLSRGEKLDLSWKPLGSEYKVWAEVGASRASLKKQSDAATAGEAGKMSLTQKPGKWFVRLTAQSQDKNKPQLVSMVIPFTIEPKAPPALIDPTAQVPVIKSEPGEEIDFHWTNRNRFFSQNLEIARDPAFRQIVAHEALSGDVTESAHALEDGTYFWRVTGYLHTKSGKDEALSSATGKFQVFSHLEIKAASLIFPPNHAHISFFDAQKTGVTLKWSQPVGVQRFQILAQRKGEKDWVTLADKETEAPLLKLAEMKPGPHQWKVTSLDPKGGPGKASEIFEFAVDDMPKLEWTQADPELEYIYTTPTPTLVGHWKSIAAAASYRYRVSPDEVALEQSSWQGTKLDKFDVSVAKDGKFVAIVEALNAKGQTIAQSDAKTFEVKRAPLLPPPRWADNAPPVFKADGKGNLSFSWEQVDGAKEYLMILENADGKPVDQRSISRTTASVNRLKPGQYKVKLKAVDAYQRPGQEGEPKNVEVPNTSDIKAPKIKAMKVK